MPLRQHDVVVAEGTLRVVLTEGRRLFTVIDAPRTALGPMRIAVEIEPRVELAPPGSLGESESYVVSGLFGGIEHALSHLAHGIELGPEGAFHLASKTAATLAHPVLGTVHDVTGTATGLIAHHLALLPESMRKPIEAASRIVMRAHLGDLHAKSFIRDVVGAVQSGVHGARELGDALLTGSRLVAHAMDFPVQILGHVPGVGGVVEAISPFAKFEKMTSLVQHGDFAGLKRMVEGDLKLVQGALSVIPGIGTPISAALSAGMAVLDGDGPLEIAIKTAYGAIPIPPGVRTVTDGVLDAVLELAKKGHELTDAAVSMARDALPSGLPRTVFDTLVHLVIHKHPPARVSGELLDHYVTTFQVSGPRPARAVARRRPASTALVRSPRLVQPLARYEEPDIEPVAGDDLSDE